VLGSRGKHKKERRATKKKGKKKGNSMSDFYCSVAWRGEAKKGGGKGHQNH
jgi:hypothetical protein